MSLPPPHAAARFIPGSVLLDRFRIVERIGHGASGEVYRADDLRLGQPVALKFLPREIGDQPARLQALFAEVRLARHVSHPGVCRVHDIVEWDGTHALSMEFVDGEDLASLLRRIGRLPADKVVALAHELCAGLAAMHEQGVLHRDLKPANVMIDGRGHARITDFGLAELHGHRGEPDTIAGTPAYMAPEAFVAGHSPTVQSDLYGLGLVLYEIATGCPAFEAATVRDIIRLRTEGPPRAPSDHVRELDPALERAIMRCLDPDPARRPRSARAVAAVLPGGDRLAAAIAAGEIPAPDMVASATTRADALRRATAWLCMTALVAGLALVVVVAPRTRLVPTLMIPEPAESMAEHARALLRERGIARPAADRAYGFEYDESVIDRMAGNPSRAQWHNLSEVSPPVVTFWYRESPAPMVPAGPRYRVSYVDPPWASGMTGVRLGTRGDLVQIDGPLGTGLPLAHPPEASAIAGADIDARPGRAGLSTSGRDPVSVTRLFAHAFRPAMFLASMLIGAWLARRNLRRGRVDTRRALRVAVAMAALRALSWVFGAHLTAASATEQIRSVLAWGLYDFAYGGLFYVAVEPYARQFWPRLLVAWARLVDGRHADARVGRDLLLGSLTGTALALMVAAHQAAPAWFGAPPGRPDNVGYIEHQLASLLGTRQQIAEILGLLHSNVVLIMGFVVILVVARLLLRRTALAIIASFLVFAPQALPRGDFFAIDITLAALSTLLLLGVLMRFGLLAAMVGLATHTLLQSAPIGMGMQSWPAIRTVVVLAIVLGIGVYGFWRSLTRPAAIEDVLFPAPAIRPRGA